MRALPPLAFALFAAVAPLRAQEIDVFVSHGRSDIHALGAPIGAGAGATAWGSGHFGVRLAYRDRLDPRSFEATVCDSYWPDFTGCVREQVRPRARLRTLSLGAVGRLPLTGSLGFEAGGSGSLTRPTMDTRGTASGRGTGDVVVEGYERGLLLESALRWSPAGRVPTLRLGLVHESIDFRGCVMDAGAPFCGSKSITSIQLGVGVRAP
jgi:hypothetical protein